jgi:hypothetical protein
MPAHLFGPDVLSPQTQAFYRHALVSLREKGVPFVLGGAYTFGHYTGILRHTKDLDVFVRPADQGRALAALAAAGYRTELTYPHWLGKAFQGDDFVDVITAPATASPSWTTPGSSTARREKRSARRSCFPRWRR